MTTTSTPAAAAKKNLYIAVVGDSYSAGTGLGAAVPFTCDRDSYAYAPRAARDLLPKTHAVRRVDHNIACMGATTNDINKSGGQASKVTTTHNVVTVTIGGNDIGFADQVVACAIRCTNKLLEVNASSVSWDTLFNRLTATYLKLAKRMSTSGHVYVNSYPIPFAIQGTAKSCAGLSWTEQKAANALVTRLGDTIYKAVGSANTNLKKEGRPATVHFVEWRTGDRIASGYKTPSGKKFDAYMNNSNGLCNTKGKTPYLNGYVTGSKATALLKPSLFIATSALVSANSFHPNSTGYWGGANVLYASIRRYQP